ncbi:MAG: hypothetical protein ABI136_06185 [Ginsengibacter sp.]
MLDLIILYFLTKEIGKIAAQKGLKPITWKIYTIVSWIASEIVGIVIGIMMFGVNNLVSIILVGFTFAITSYFLIKAQLNRLPDKSFDDDINNIGRF